MLHISAIIMINVCLALQDCFFPFAFVVAELQTNAKPGAEKVVSRSPRGPTLGEISYALAEITEIKFEIAKSSSLKRNHKLVLKSEISPQYTMFP